MRSKPSRTAPFFRSDVQGRILASIMLGAEDQTLSDLATAVEAPLTTVQREIATLSEAGVVKTRKVGRARVVSMDTSYPLLAPLSEIVAATYGPAPVITDEFRGLDGADKVIIFGSWAARSLGVSGHFPQDIDVLVVGSVSQLEAIERAMNAAEKIGREVNVTTVDPERWSAASDGFVKDVQSKPFLDLGGLGDADAA